MKNKRPPRVPAYRGFLVVMWVQPPLAPELGEKRYQGPVKNRRDYQRRLARETMGGKHK